MNVLSRWFGKRQPQHGSSDDESGDCDGERRNEDRQRADAERTHLRWRIAESERRAELLELQADVESRRGKR